MSLSLDILVSGIVQGVGFRPFIKRIAVKSGVYGYVQNLGGGEVIIHVEGDRRDVLRFLRLFREERPPPAEIIHMKVEKVKVDGLKDFTILRSASNLLLPSIIPPDIGICSDCISEIERNSRWSKYAFNSCAWCGPRYSMMYRSPYDRENTSMDDFPLCPDCLSEYKDVTNIRRFHAQGISCPKCGPKIWLCDNSGQYIDAEDPIAEAAKLMDEGGIIGIKGIGGFHIAALANDDEVINELRRRKRRPMKPFALMALDLASVRKIAHLPDSAIELISSPQRPILLLRKREDADVSKLIAPGLDLIGVMLPYSGIHHLFLNASDNKYVIMTSGNYYNKPMEKDNSSAVKRLGGIVDYFLLHNREIVNRVDDSVLRFTNNKPVFLRRSRGYAPRWIKLPRRMRHHAIAFGAELQNVGGVGFGDKAILTQFIGDTDEYENT
jgi:hydrogenase maturation protein HypF